MIDNTFSKICLGNFWKKIGKFLENVWKIFGLFLGPLGPPGAPKWAQGPRGSIWNPPKKFQKFGPEVSTIFEILIFGFLGVFLMEIWFFQILLYFLPRGALAPPLGPRRRGSGGAEPPPDPVPVHTLCSWNLIPPGLFFFLIENSGFY